MGVTVFTQVCVSVNMIIYLLLYEGMRTPQWRSICCDLSPTALSTTVLSSEMLVCFVDTKCVPLRLLQLPPPVWYVIAARLQPKPELCGRRLTSGQVRYAGIRHSSLSQHVVFFPHPKSKTVPGLHSEVSQHRNMWKALSDVKREPPKGLTEKHLGCNVVYLCSRYRNNW